MAEWLRVAVTCSMLMFVVVGYFATAEPAAKDLIRTLRDTLYGRRPATVPSSSDPIPTEPPVRGDNSA